MDYKTVRDKVLASEAFFRDAATSKEKFDAVRTILKGINPRVDKLLDACGKQVVALEHIEKGAVLELTAEALPTATEKDKKRKKLLILFLKSWNDLKAEVDRIKAESASSEGGNAAAKASSFGRILAGAKGPLGLVTLLAAGMVALQVMAVRITIRNQGCETINPVVSIPVPIAGISLPKDPIADGGSGVATAPPLTVTVDGSSPGSINLGILGYQMHFALNGDRISVSLDGVPLSGRVQTVRLSEKKEHELLIACR